MQNLPTTVYYYCSLRTFLNIIKKRTIWLNEIGKSNDSLEQKYLALELLKDLQANIKSIYPKVRTVKRWINEWLLKIDTIQPDPAWVMCFSELSDELNMWRAYGDNGTGISLGFDMDYLNAINEIDDVVEIDHPFNEFFRFRKVEYGNLTICHYLKNLLDENGVLKVAMNEAKCEIEKEINDIFTRPYYKSA